MIVRLKKPISPDKGRHELATYLSLTVEASERPHFTPYMRNEGDTKLWTIDGGNDWNVRFFDHEPNDFEIVHRYDDKVAAEGLSAWVAYRLGGTLRRDGDG